MFMIASSLIQTFNLADHPPDPGIHPEETERYPLENFFSETSTIESLAVDSLDWIPLDYQVSYLGRGWPNAPRTAPTDQGRTAGGVQGGRRRPLAACPAHGLPEGRRRVGHGGPR
jgi:hypothetical protein